MDDNTVHVLDVKRKSEYQTGYIHEHKNVVHTRLASRLKVVPTDKILVVYCGGGVRSAYASALLERAGFDAINFQGGMQRWEK